MRRSLLLYVAERFDEAKFLCSFCSSGHSPSLTPTSLSRRSKVSTGLVGLAVNPRARQECIALFEQMLEKSKMFPSGVAYRASVEKTANQRLSVLRDESKTAEAVEGELGVQLEELQVEATDELRLMPVMLQSRAWEVAANHEVPIKVVDF